MSTMMSRRRTIRWSTAKGCTRTCGPSRELCCCHLLLTVRLGASRTPLSLGRGHSRRTAARHRGASVGRAARCPRCPRVRPGPVLEASACSQPGAAATHASATSTTPAAAGRGASHTLLIRGASAAPWHTWHGLRATQKSSACAPRYHHVLSAFCPLSSIAASF
jgi:hypothetical protein